MFLTYPAFVCALAVAALTVAVQAVMLIIDLIRGDAEERPDGAGRRGS
jgi:hypothetical protein